MRNIQFVTGPLKVTFVIALLVLAAIITGVSARHAARTDPNVARKGGGPMPVALYTVAVHDVEEHLVVVGTLSPDRKPSLQSMVDAGVKQVLVADGDLVEEGQVLVLLDPTEYEAKLSMARNEAGVMREAWDTAQGAWERKHTLFLQKGTSATELEKAEKTLRTAELDREQAEANIARIENQIAACTVRAPARGIVRDVIDQGWVRASAITRLVELEVIEPLWAEGPVHESYLPLLTPDMPVQVSVPAFPGETFPARLGPAIPMIERNTQTGGVRVRLEQTDARLLPGMTALLHFSFPSHGAAVPRIALFNRLGREASIFRIRDSVAELVAVRLGRIGADWAEIVAGVEEGDTIVQTGHLQLQEGDRVQEVK